jgi:hypothetical protein
MIGKMEYGCSRTQVVVALGMLSVAAEVPAG